jgi:hypothetical protein
MTHTRIASVIGLALPLIGIVLALANWNARPEKGWAWLVAIVIFVVMVAVRHLALLAARRSSGDTSSARTLASIPRAVAVGALMMVIPLGVTLAHAYGLVSDRDGGIHATMIILGLYLAATGNALPRALPPASSMPGNAAQVQAFQRFAGWTWVIGGLGFALAWLALPKDAAVLVSVALVAAAFIVTIVQLLRLRKPGGSTLRA